MSREALLEALSLRVSFRARLFAAWRRNGPIDVDRVYADFEWLMAATAPVA